MQTNFNYITILPVAGNDFCGFNSLKSRFTPLNTFTEDTEKNSDHRIFSKADDFNDRLSRGFFTVLTALVIFSISLSSNIIPSEAAILPYLYEIKIPFIVGGSVLVEYNNGKEQEIGKVLALPTKTRWPSYSASAWGIPGEVCASAVNAVHLLVSIEKDSGRTMSIIPQETIAPAAGPGASVIISSEASTGIFGAWSPPVGSEVSIISKSSLKRTPFGIKTIPDIGDTMIITVQQKILPFVVEIENRPGGRITEWNSAGFKLLGRVIKPVAGTGRFEGTLFQRVGALRANHCGVMDFSTSPKGEIGGFQIIPWDHALKSKEMQGAWDMTQWLIAGPIDGHSMLGGQFPLFKNALVPGPSDGEKLWDVWSTYGRKSLILARINGGKWQRLPSISGRNDQGLKSITHLKIYFPFTDEPQR